MPAPVFHGPACVELAVLGQIEIEVDRLVRLDIAEIGSVNLPSNSSAFMNMLVCEISRVSRKVSAFLLPSSGESLISAS